MVIQRLQNLYLFLSAVLMTVFAYINVFFVESADLSLSVGCMGTYDVNGLSLSPISIVLAVLAVVLPLLTLSKFKLLKLQKSLCAVCLVAKLGLIAYLAITIFGQYSASSVAVNYVAVALIAAAAVLDLLARRGIAHDIKLLRDSDRIR